MKRQSEEEQNMEFKLNTHQLQLIVIATISAATEKHHIERGWDKDYDELTELFAKLNRMTKKDNDWTLSFSVEG